MSNKVFFGFILAFGLGGLTGYLVTRKILEDAMNDEIDEARQFYVDKVNDMEEKIDEIKKEVRPVDLSNHDSEYVHYSKIVSSYKKPELDELATARLTRGEPADGEDDEDEEVTEQDILDDMEKRSNEMAAVKNPEPYLINYHQFMNDNQHYDKIDLYYYNEDDVTCGDDDQEIEDPEELIGYDIYDLLDNDPVSSGFVRNERLHTDYEIHKIFDSYSDSVGGKAETDKERMERRIARKKEAMDDHEEHELNHDDD